MRQILAVGKCRLRRLEKASQHVKFFLFSMKGERASLPFFVLGLRAGASSHGKPTRRHLDDGKLDPQKSLLLLAEQEHTSRKSGGRLFLCNGAFWSCNEDMHCVIEPSNWGRRP